MADETVLRARLEEAEGALHQLMIGAMEVEVEYEGSRVKMKPADEARLRRYVNGLKRQLGEDAPAGSRRVMF